MAIHTRITDMLGIEKPIIQAAMGWIARSQLSSAVSNAGGMGIIETSSGELEIIREEILKMRDMTEKPFGVNVAQAFIRDPKIIDFIIDQGVKFVTTSAGDPMKYTSMLKEADLTVFHVVPSLKGALRAIEAGVDGRSMAAAFALGAEGILMGTRILSSLESPVHNNWKDAIVSADSTDTVFLNRSGPGPALRALRTERTTRLQKEGIENIFGEFADTQDVYFDGNLEAGIALTGQVAGRIKEIKPIKQIFDETLKEFGEVTGRLASLSR
jgi:enoyl-[acyl-carrier protein] reductase II